MRYRFHLLLILILAFPLKAKAELIVVEVSGMECALCAEDVIKSISQLPGTSEVHADVITQAIRFESNQGMPLEAAIRKAIRNSGYTVKSILHPEEKPRDTAH